MGLYEESVSLALKVLEKRREGERERERGGKRGKGRREGEVRLFSLCFPVQ